MHYTQFIKCLISGTWSLRGHSYRFLCPAYHNNGYFTVDGISHSDFTFEVRFENGLMFLFINADKEETPLERYRVLDDYCLDRLTMIHEVRNAEGNGYEMPSEVHFEKEGVEMPVAPKANKRWANVLASKLHGFVRKAGEVLNPKAA